MIMVTLPKVDQEFFATHPGRQFRIRLASAGEISKWNLDRWPLPPELFIHAVVSDSGIIFFVAAHLQLGDAPEEQANRCWSVAYSTHFEARR